MAKDPPTNFPGKSTFVNPSKNAVLWRYLDFTKFISMLDGKSLYFSRADKLGDPFEASYAPANYRRLMDIKQFLYPQLLEGQNPEGASKVVAEFADAGLRQGTFVASLASKSCFVSCWHMNKYESAAMWKIYLKSDEGIAIRTTAKKLGASVEHHSDKVQITKVKYIDYQKETINASMIENMVAYKRKSFSYEKEVRAVIRKHPRMKHGDHIDEGVYSDEVWPAGIHVAANLDVLIQDVFVSPAMPTWFRNLIQKSLSKYGLNKEVHHSSLDRTPLK